MIEKCTYCGLTVNTEDLHTDSLPLPSDGSEYRAAHVNCVQREDLKPEEFKIWYEAALDEEVNQGWIIV